MSDSLALRDSNAIVLPYDRLWGVLGTSPAVSKTRQKYTLPTTNGWESYINTSAWAFRLIGADSFPAIDGINTLNGFNVYSSLSADSVKTLYRYGLDASVKVTEIRNANEWQCATENFEPLDTVTADPCGTISFPAFIYGDYDTTTANLFTGVRVGRLVNSGTNPLTGAYSTLLGSGCVASPSTDTLVFEGWVKYTGSNNECCLRIGKGTTPTNAFHSGSGNWEHLRVMVDLISWTNPVGCSLVTDPSVGGRGPTYFDDFRVYPRRASVTTKTYDPRIFMLLSESGPDNVPVKFRYDGFGRLLEIRNFKDEALETREYSLSRTSSPSGPFAIANNYVKTTSHWGAGSDSTAVSASYMDALGRVIQTRSQEDATAYRIGLVGYDARGRTDTTWKPFVDTGVNYDTGARTTCANYYDGNPGPDCQGYPYSVKLYQLDPSGREREFGAPGQNFRIQAGHTVRYAYGSATADEVDGYGLAKELREVTITDEDGFVTRQYTDKLGRDVSTFRDSVATVIKSFATYDVLGRVTSSKDPRGLTLVRTYNSLGEIIREKEPDAGARRLLFDRMGRLRFDMDSASAAGDYFVYFKYDGLGRRIEWGTVPGATRFTQANANNAAYPLTSFSDEFINRYDGPISGGGVNSQGRLVRSYNPTSSIYRAMIYDSLGRIREESVYVASLSAKRLKYYYNRAGKLVREVFLNSSTDSAWTDYAYTRAGQVSQIKDDGTVLAEYTYWPTGAPRAATYKKHGGASNIQVVDYKYNSRDWLERINDSTGQGGSADRFALYLQYDSLDANSVRHYNGTVSTVLRRTQDRGDAVVDSLLSKFEYDGLNRVFGHVFTTNGGSTLTEDFTYDRNSNITYHAIEDGPFESFTYESTSNHMTTKSSPGATNYTYNLAGEEKTRGSNTFNFSWRNLLGSYEVPHGASPNMLYFDYDPFRQRVKANYHYWDCDYTGCNEDLTSGGEGEDSLSQGSSTIPADSGGAEADAGGGGGPCGECGTQTWHDNLTYFIYDQFGRVIAEYQGTSLARRYYYLRDARFAMRDISSGSKLFYMLGDQVGSSRALVQATNDADSGIFAAQYDFYPYGQVQAASVSTDPKYLYGGHRYHSEGSINVYNLGARFYDHVAMRTLSPDPTGQHFSPYSYTAGNPIAFSDPSGAFDIFSMIAIASGIMSWARDGNVLHILQGAVMAASMEIGPQTNLFEGKPLGGGLQGPTQINVLREISSVAAQAGLQDIAFQLAWTGRLNALDWRRVGYVTLGGAAARSLHFAPSFLKKDQSIGELFADQNRKLGQKLFGSKTGGIASSVAFGALWGAAWISPGGPQGPHTRERGLRAWTSKFAGIFNLGSWVGQGPDQGSLDGLFDWRHFWWGIIGGATADQTGVQNPVKAMMIWNFYGFETLMEGANPWEFGDFFSDLYGAQAWNFMTR